MTTDLTNNPLLEDYTLPPFSRLKPEHVEPALDHAIAEARQQVNTLVENLQQPDWDSLVQPMEEMEVRIDKIWSPISHLNGVMNSEELRKAYNACLPKLSEFGTELGQHEGLYQAYKHIADGSEYDRLDTAQKKVIDNAVRDFRLSGVELNPPQREQFKKISQKLTELSARYEENLLDATHAWKKHITDESRLAGLPESTKDMLAQFAEREKLEGWLLTLDFPCYMPVMAYAEDRDLREEVYTAFATKASDEGPHAGQFDNTQIMNEILDLRHQQAQLLGFANHAERSLATKMAQSPQQVLEFLNDLAARSKPIAEKEFAELRAYAKEQCGLEELEAWDVTYWAEHLRQQRYSISQEELKPYFPQDKVVDGLFAVVNRLYGLEIRENTDADVWHPDVRFFEIVNKDGEIRAQFYLDLYARQGKRGGAWMDECLVRHRTANGIQTPVAFLTCNFSEPVGDKPALFTHDEVATLFHEFGHGLHHMLTKIDYSGVSGINGVAWDAVELPSQFMENWCWEREALDLIAGHYETGEKIPNELYEKMLAARNFQSAMMMLRQLEFSLFDFRLHLEYEPGKPNQVDEILSDVRDAVAVVRPPKFNRFAHSFGHIFAGGYAAGYYSYKWAEVLSSDAFSKFEENGIFDRQTGVEFLEAILEQGGSREPMELFIAFRGREPQIDALLRHSGIAA